jgi:hypothetical protein
MSGGIPMRCHAALFNPKDDTVELQAVVCLIAFGSCCNNPCKYLPKASSLFRTEHEGMTLREDRGTRAPMRI